MTKEEFNNAIKLARKQGMAVGLDIFIQGGGHAINLWGAEFTLEETERSDRGTDIILHVDEDCKEFLEESRL